MTQTNNSLEDKFTKELTIFLQQSFVRCYREELSKRIKRGLRARRTRLEKLKK